MWRRVTWLPLFATLIFASLASAQVYCGRPVGLYLREIAHTTTAPIRAFASRLAGSGDYLIVSRISRNGLGENDLRAARDAALDAYLESPEFAELRQDDLVKSIIDERIKVLEPAGFSEAKIRETTEREIAELSFSKAEDDVQSHLGGGGGSEDFFYLYTSHKGTLIELAGSAASEHGVTIEGTPTELASFLTVGEISDHPLKRIVANKNIKAVIIHDSDGATDLDRFAAIDVPVIRLKNAKSIDQKSSGRIERGVNWIESHRNKQSTVINLFPKAPEEAEAWGFDSAMARSYSDAGRAFDQRASSFGGRTEVKAPRTKQGLYEAIAAATSSDRNVIVIGEASEAGSIRIPGSTDVVTKADLEAAGDLSRVSFISCHSDKLELGDANLSLVGKIYSRKAATLLEMLIPRDPHDDTISVRLDERDALYILVLAIAEATCIATSQAPESCTFGLYSTSNS